MNTHGGNQEDSEDSHARHSPHAAGPDQARERAGAGRVSGPAVFAGVVLGGFTGLAVLAALLVVSPASFVSLLPDWFAEDGSGGIGAWVVAGLSAAGAAVLTVRRRVRPLRGIVVAVLVLVAAGAVAHALGTSSRDKPAPENTCVAYSGGRHTCRGG